jgi:hypothetical protein
VFEATLEAQLKRIFRVEKVTFDKPGDSEEQEGLFVDVHKAKTRLRDKRQIALVQGTIHIFAQASKLKYGFFSKALAEAQPADTRKLFFFNFEENKGTFGNIAERSLDFLYLFDSQHDPALDTIESVEINIAES